MPELFLFLLTLGTALITILDKIDLAERRRLARKIHEIYNQLQTIIDDADKIFTLIQTADEQIKEYGEDKFTKIIKDNFDAQSFRIIELAKIFIDPDISIIFEKLDDKLKKRLVSMLRYKRDSIWLAIKRMAHSKMKIKNGQLYILDDPVKQKQLAFPKIDKQLKTLSKLKECSKSLEVKISSMVDLKDLL